jgi:hypothetical protein
LGEKTPWWRDAEGFYIHPERSNADGWYLTSSTGGGVIGRLKPGITAELSDSEFQFSVGFVTLSIT